MEKGSHPVVLVQREQQYAALQAALLRCGDQRGHVALITGAVGSGKTTLLESFTEKVSADGRCVLSAAGSRAERNLPFTVMGQLFHCARLAESSASRVDALMRDAAFAGPLPEPGAETPGHLRANEKARAPVLHGLFTELLALAEPAPLVVAVDDAHHADPASLHCLLYLVRRLRSTQIMVVLTESAQLQPAYPMFRAELASQPYFTRIVLHPLSADALAQMAGRDLDPAMAQKVSDNGLTITGGNPLLARGLIDDQSVAHHATEDPGAPHPGDLFDHAVLACLYRLEPGVRRVAQALAVLAAPAPAELVGQLLDVVPEFVTQATRILRTSGLVATDHLRHPRIQRALLGDIPADESRGLHRRAASVLHEHGAAAHIVARHLVAADWAGERWVVPVLHDAAAHALSAGRPDVSGACLRLAGRGAIDGRQRIENDAMLANARWQVNPLAATEHVADLVRAARADGQPSATVLAAVPYLLWQGQVEEAVETMSHVACDEPVTATTAATAAQLRVVQLLISLSHPDHLARIRDTPSTWTRAAITPSTVSPQLQAVTVLAAALMPAADNDVVTAAEQILQRYGTDDGALGLLTAPLIAMVYAGRPDRASVWAERLLDRPVLRHAPIWRAILSAIKAETAVRLGDLPAAERLARAAFHEIVPAAWGVAVGGPLATLVTCATEMGRFDDADRWLGQRVPAGLFHTPFGLHYLQARGRYHLAENRPDAAVSDLRLCGDLMRSWELDIAAVVPWRLELARAQLSMGRRPDAVELIQDQLRGPHAIDDRTRGTALRLLASTAPPHQRGSLLAEAVNLLQGCGDRMELARALADTGQVLRGLGDVARGRLMVRRAYQIAQECGATVLAARLLRREPSAGLASHAGPPGPEPDDGLSEAERRVATLAAQGNTNRQISGKLYITVSTVEQHLTRVYRKLKVKRRADLPARLVAHTHAQPLLDQPRVEAS